MPGQGKSSSERAYTALKRRIVRCELEPGFEFSEATVSDLLELGRTPVREALSRLVHEGLVQVRARQGYRVNPISLADVRHVFELRLILEPAAAELAVRHSSSEHLAALHTLAHAARRDDPDEADQYLSDHLAFHVALAERSGNPRLAKAVSDLLIEMERMLRLSLRHEREAPGEEHHQLYEALVAGDASAARAATVLQIERSRERVVRALMDRISDPDHAQPGDVDLG